MDFHLPSYLYRLNRERCLQETNCATPPIAGSLSRHIWKELGKTVNCRILSQMERIKVNCAKICPDLFLGCPQWPYDCRVTFAAYLKGARQDSQSQKYVLDGENKSKLWKDLPRSLFVVSVVANMICLLTGSHDITHETDLEDSQKLLGGLDENTVLLFLFLLFPPSVAGHFVLVTFKLMGAFLSMIQILRDLFRQLLIWINSGKI